MFQVFIYTFPQHEGASLLFFEEEPSEEVLACLSARGEWQLDSKILTFNSKLAAVAAGVEFSDPREFVSEDYDEPLGEEYDD